MSNSIVAAIYRYVIDDVVRNVQADFEGHGVDTSVLEELQRSWEAKIIQSRVASFPGEDAGNDIDNATVGGRGGVNPPGGYSYNAHGASDAATSGNINSAASLASIINNHESSAPSAASLASLAQSGRGQLLMEDDEDADGDHSHYGGHGSGSHIPQNDGPGDERDVAEGDAMAKWNALRNARRLAYEREQKARDAGAISQVDGASDDDDDEDGGDRANDDLDGNREAPEDAINSDLDDTDEEDDYEGGAEETEHIVLCQYDKVTRSKNKWKCVLRDGIMLINGRDYLFQKATGDFEW
ncbi:transcription factor IIA subunit alpha [Kickxella alabastrina]|uniref:Transcription factor IIA subunit alpha n=1 Tax=Kickxella alabastrina TaxID=61397 RepID=A0ACC1I4P7_9FUNG|nr:transcription factor IIA subunit alpha [Kickxella alabastrina]